ncbi:hypothetical protein BGX31_003645 [Mortierella sp. GBA43]|nr:hypothetical protein BGX31_003645 [Mortierella sp. GBA43]
MEASTEESREWYKERGWHFDSNNDFVDKDGQFCCFVDKMARRRGEDETADNDVPLQQHVLGSLFDYESDQEHYEYVQLEIKELIFAELEKRFQLERLPVPTRRIDKDNQRDSPTCPQVFVSPDVRSNHNLLIIVQGLGEVPPGQWARKLFTNGEKGQFDLATQFPYIQRALHAGWAVVLCDPNRNEGRLRTQLTRSHHVRRVWEDVVRPSSARCVMIAAFSAGSCSTLDLYQSIEPEFTERVKAIALLDGENGLGRYSQLEDDGQWLREHSQAFSKRTVEEFMIDGEHLVPTDDHDCVPGLAVDAVFDYFKKEQARYESMLPEDDSDKHESGPQRTRTPTRQQPSKPYVPSPHSQDASPKQ